MVMIVTNTTIINKQIMEGNQEKSLDRHSSKLEENERKQIRESKTMVEYKHAVKINRGESIVALIGFLDSGQLYHFR